MPRIYKDITELIGNTPLLELERFSQKQGVLARLLGKVELFNPAGSVKDRIAKAMIENAERKGLLQKDSVIVEPTSGNTGIGLAAVAAMKGYRVVLTMPETMSIERRKLLYAYGADIVLTEGSRGMQGAIDKAVELCRELPHAFMPSQFENPANPDAHRRTTGPEIWADTDGHVDFFVAGIGTGGTITGVGEFLKQQNPAVGIIAVEPSRSPMLSNGHAGPHGIQGIGANFVPTVLNTKAYDEIMPVTDEHAYEFARELCKTEGLLVGISAGAALWAATQVGKRKMNQGKTVVVLLPDTGERYLSTPLFES